MAITQKIVQQWADEHGIELEITVFGRKYTNHGRPGINHVHAYTRNGEVFGSSDLHNLSVWDMDCAAPVDWSEVLADLCNHMPVPCPFALANGGSGCEVCDEDLDGTDFDRHEFPEDGTEPASSTSDQGE